MEKPFPSHSTKPLTLLSGARQSLIGRSKFRGVIFLSGSRLGKRTALQLKGSGRSQSRAVVGHRPSHVPGVDRQPGRWAPFSPAGGGAIQGHEWFLWGGDGSTKNWTKSTKSQPPPPPTALGWAA
ncbi:disheveled-associated activator of morphogenesis 1 [Platysternon megacephalum]|uniref:Disheveled-associated activator of morphogenesis 1 n=1 Tax=Platysternon megacephalum TaxID=55544 RepID=A0A4D9E9C0_9SAUR|nr:disheveled-associated activator of morphogenesis 1 [Platysternon megacephalum]